MFILITILILLVSIALVFVVMIQKSKGGGLGSAFASSNNILGAHKTTDALEKTTWWLIGIVMGLCVISTAFLGGHSTSEEEKMQQAVERSAASSTPSTPVVPQIPAVAP